MNYLNRALLFAACFVCMKGQAAQPAKTPTSSKFYTELGAMVLSAEQSLITNQDENDNDETETVLPPLNTQPQPNAPIDISIKIAPRAAQLKTWFSLLNKLASKPSQERIFNKDVAEKLNIISGTPSDTKHSILGNLPLITLVGTASAAETLTLCNNTQENQEIVAYFAQNQEILNAIQSALHKIEVGTGMYLTFMEQQGDAEKATFDQLYFTGYFKPLNKNIAAFTATHFIKHLMLAWKMTPPGSEILAGVKYYDTYQESASDLSILQKAKLYLINTPMEIGKEIVTTQIEKHSFPPTGINRLQDLKDMLTMSLTGFGKAYFNILRNSVRGSLGDNAKLYTDLHAPSSIAMLIACGSQIFVDIQYAYAIRTTIQNIAFENTIFANIQTRLMGVAKIVEGLVELNTIVQRSNIASLQKCVQEIEQLLVYTQGNSEIGSLINRLLTKTFQGDSSYWSNRPRILVAYDAMLEHKNVFVPALRAAGMVDALQAAAQLYLDHQEKSAHYTFVKFVYDELPTIKLINFWNPLMRAEKAVCNSVHLGNGGDKNMLLTGPNGSGKSVNMKAIALDIILAQAFGIAAADGAVMTPFTMIETYLNEQEDLQQDLSTFMAEAKKLDNICKRIRNLKPGQKSFVLMDEMLKGTVEEAGSQKVYEAGLEIAQQDNNICIMATHFLKPTNLEVDTNRGFVNYHVELLEPELGQFVRTFQLVPEANLWWFGKNATDTAKRVRFISWLISLNS